MAELPRDDKFYKETILKIPIRKALIVMPVYFTLELFIRLLTRKF